MKIIKEYIKVIISIISLMIFFSISIPLLLEYVVYRSTIYSTISNGEIASFLGSYLGGIIGGGITLITMYISIRETRKDLRREERVKNRSYIDTFSKKSQYGTLGEFEDYYKGAKVIIDDDYIILLENPVIIAKNKGVMFIGIENCGSSIIKDLKVDILNENKEEKSFFITRVLIGEVFFIPIVYSNLDDIGYCVEKITLTYRTLSNEIIVISKIFEKNYRYAEKIDVYEKYDYKYDSQQCRWMDISSLN